MNVVDLYEYFGILKKSVALLPMDFGTKFCHIFSSKFKLVKGELYCYNEEEIGEKKPAILICPGGAYLSIAHSEWEKIVEAFSARGFRAFVLNYSVKYFKFPTQLNEAVMAMLYLRQNADALGISDKIVVCGFSAGGHLAGSLANLYADSHVNEKLLNSGFSARPDACILSYPVVSSDESIRNAPSFRYLCGGDKNLEKYLSLDLRVSENTPPTFLWHTKEDMSVPCENSIRYVDSLQKYGIPHKFCLYQEGPHGLDLAKGYEAEAWFEESLSFLKGEKIF